MRNNTIALIVAGAVLALGTAACGDGGSAQTSTPTPSSTGVAARDITADVADICTAWKNELDARPPFPVQNFDPGNPDPNLLPAVGDYFAPAITLQEQTIDKLHALVANSSQGHDLDALVTALETEVTNTREQVRAARNHEVENFKATVVNVDTVRSDVQRAAEALDAKGCAFAP